MIQNSTLETAHCWATVSNTQHVKC